MIQLILFSLCCKQQIHTHCSHRDIAENALIFRDTTSLMSKMLSSGRLLAVGMHNFPTLLIPMTCLAFSHKVHPKSPSYLHCSCLLACRENIWLVVEFVLLDL
jgi:hypothetical protein